MFRIGILSLRMRMLPPPLLLKGHPSGLLTIGGLKHHLYLDVGFHFVF